MTKRIGASLICFIICILIVFSGTAYAGIYESHCIINGDFESIDYNGQKYLLLETDDTVYCDSYDYDFVEYRYSDSSVEERYTDVDVYRYYDTPYLLEVSYWDDTCISKIFASESHYDDISDFLSGKKTNEYITHNHHDDLGFRFSEEYISDWIRSSEKVTGRAHDFSDHYYSISMVYANDILHKESGLIIEKIDDNSDTSSFYLLWYDDYDSSYFNIDGSFPMEYSSREITVYKLNDEEMASTLYDYYNDMFYNQKHGIEDNEDDAMFKISRAIFFAVTVFFFGIIPLASLAFAVIMLILKRPQKLERNMFIIMAAASAVVIACYITLITLIP